MLVKFDRLGNSAAAQAQNNGVSATQQRSIKRLFDIIVALALLPVLIAVGGCLLLLNPWFNPGPLLYRQRRMGLARMPFYTWKLRSMAPQTDASRGAFDQLEVDRITPLGRILRKTRLDELPQLINVLRGQMSLIGPRPDLYDHALHYITQVPGYAARQQITPGISGYAQTEVGYVDGFAGIKAKVAADLHYIAHASLRFDLWIAWRTICVIMRREGR